MDRRQFIARLGATTSIAVAASPLLAAEAQDVPFSTDVFVSGAEGIHTYRIPAMLRAPNDALLVFCEARKESIRDASPTALVLRRSLDNGETWLDFAASKETFNIYSLGGCREVTEDGDIIGSFTDQQGSNLATARGSSVYFFKIKAAGDGRSSR